MNISNLFSSINPREVVKNLPDAVFVVDFDGRIVWANDKATVIFESKISDLKGLNLEDIVVNGLEAANKSYARRTSIVTGAFTPDGKEFFIEMNAKKYIDQYFVTIRDVTTMTNVLATAEKTGKLNKEKNLMLVKLSNEFKSPLQSIIGFSQALLDGLGGEINDKQEKYVKIINKNSAELLYFWDKFIEFAQAESSLFNNEEQTFDLINMLQSVVRNNEQTINAKNITINFDIEEFLKKTITTNENALKIIMQNIIENSIKLTETGSITIKVSNPSMEVLQQQDVKAIKNTKSFVQISVTDTGMGLAETEMEGLFEPYTQLDKSHKKTIVRSFSLGTAYTIAKRMGGTVWVNSEVMKGSTFNIIIPNNKC